MIHYDRQRTDRLANRKILTAAEADILLNNYSRLKTYEVCIDLVTKEYMATSDLYLIEFLEETENMDTITDIQEKIISYRPLYYSKK